MRSNKSDQECAEILYAVLRDGAFFTRKQIVDRNILSNHDFGKGRKELEKAGLLRNVHKSGYTLSIHALGGPPEEFFRYQSCADKHINQFDPLLSAWNIERLPTAIGTSSRINRRFAREEEAGADAP